MAQGQNDWALKLYPAALRHLDRALELDPDMSDAHILILRCAYRYSQADPQQRGQLIERSRVHLKKARDMVPEHPNVLVQLGIVTTHNPAAPDPAKGKALMERALVAYAKRDGDQDPHLAWWHAFALGSFGWQLMQQNPPGSVFGLTFKQHAHGFFDAVGAGLCTFGRINPTDQLALVRG